LPLGDHPSFDRPSATTRLWRYTDLPKLIELLTSSKIWLASAEILAQDDPYEGLPGAIQFPHRMWRSIDEVPKELRSQILEIYGKDSNGTPEAAFRLWMMVEEQRCIMTLSGRRNYYVNCWHAAEYESVAMWKVYGSPGAGVAVISNGARIEHSLSSTDESFYLGKVRYVEPSFVRIGGSNAFDDVMIKRSNFEYEREVRLVYWDTSEGHDALENFSWNAEKLRFDDLIDDPRPVNPGMAFDCEVDVLIERIIVSPFAPDWYAPMLDRLRDRLGYRFSVHKSELLAAPPRID